MSTPTYEKIQHIELTGSQSSITFSSIPQTYTDLMLVFSGRTDRSALGDAVLVSFNGSTSSFSARFIEGDGSTVVSGSQARYSGGVTGASTTSNTFGNVSVYIPNYTSNTNKTYSVDSTVENNATTAYIDLAAGLWSNTAAITSITLNLGTGPNFISGSSATLYGIKSIPSAPKATGGIISYVNGYWVHTFTSSGTFTPTQNLSNVEYLVVAGGGAGGNAVGYSEGAGGAGAGGYRSSVVGESSGGGASAESRLSLTSGTNYTVTVGAGGAGRTTYGRGTDGSSSAFNTITTVGGGPGGIGGGGQPGGSGSGAGGDGGSGRTGGTGTTNQGYAGGAVQDGTRGGGGGGGAGAVGGSSTGGSAGSGGNGVTSAITGTSLARAGGGAGMNNSGVYGSAGSGGAGAGGAVNAAPNTGSGGAGVQSGTSGNGGSGIVVVRYQ